MKETGKRTKCRVKVRTITLMVLFTEDSGKTINIMAKEYTNLPMPLCIKESGNITLCMEPAFLLIIMVKNGMGNIGEAYSRAKVKTN